MISRYNWFGLWRRHNSVPPETTSSLPCCTSLHLTMDISTFVCLYEIIVPQYNMIILAIGMNLWNGGTAERRSGGWCGEIAEWQNGYDRMVEWQMAVSVCLFDEEPQARSACF